MSCSERGHEGQLPRQHGAADHTGQLTGILTRLVGAGALNAEHLRTAEEKSGGARGVMGTVFGAILPAGRPAAAAGGCHPPQFPVLLKALCS